MAKGRRLKVFQARFGFYDTVVAAPSQTAALRAWGVRQNLFADGAARIAEDARAVAAALEHPETPLRRPLGSDQPFALDPTGLPELPDEPRRNVATTAKPAVPPPPPAPDRSALEAAEGALTALDTARKREEAAFRRRQDDLDAERQAAQHTYVDRRKAALVAISKARSAYRKARGEAAKP